MAINHSTLLVFPINVDSAIPVIRTAKMLGYRIIGASSVEPRPQLAELDACIHLPFVTSPDFHGCFAEALERHRITHVLAPHHGVWSHLKALSAQASVLPYTLCGKHPFEQNWENLRPSLDWAASMHSDAFADTLAPLACRTPPRLSTAEYTSIHRGFLRIPGESDMDKLYALCAIARVTPPGDVVEIGSLYGRSAYALGRLAHAHAHAIGSTLCIDPWRLEDLTDQGAQAGILESGRKLIDLDRVFLEFLATATEVPGMGYIRKPSVSAVEDYRVAAACGRLHPPELSPIPVCGHISLLHIDGNHRYDQVLQDIETWFPYLAGGGWLLLDDYVWAFGDGPKIAGDQLLESGEFDQAFTSSDTLFLRRASPCI